MSTIKSIYCVWEQYDKLNYCSTGLTAVFSCKSQYLLTNICRLSRRHGYGINFDKFYDENLGKSLTPADRTVKCSFRVKIQGHQDHLTAERLLNLIRIFRLGWARADSCLKCHSKFLQMNIWYIALVVSRCNNAPG